jgi:hypothetical protein
MSSCVPEGALEPYQSRGQARLLGRVAVDGRRIYCLLSRIALSVSASSPLHPCLLPALCDSHKHQAHLQQVRATALPIQSQSLQRRCQALSTSYYSSSSLRSRLRPYSMYNSRFIVPQSIQDASLTQNVTGLQADALAQG